MGSGGEGRVVVYGFVGEVVEYKFLWLKCLMFNLSGKL